MADEIAWVVTAVDTENLTVQYTMGAHMVELRIPIPSALDSTEHIKIYAPRVTLMGMSNPPVDLAGLVGLTGTADIDPPNAAPPATA